MMALFLKKKTFLFSGRGKISHFVMTYKCPHCGYETSEPASLCPHCRTDGKKVSMISVPSLLVD
jgi:rubrerythrin